MSSKLWKYAIGIAIEQQSHPLCRAKLKCFSSKASLPVLTLYTKVNL